MKKLKLLASLLFIGLLSSCGSSTSSGSDSTETANTAETDDATFYASQPVESGLYDASEYDITGENERKGKFDGRIYFSLSPQLSAFYVFENGNRTKIDYKISLKHPFQKEEDGVFKSEDTKDQPVTITPDSTFYSLEFSKNDSKVKIIFNPKPRHTGTALEILEKINQTAEKNKK